MRNLTAKYLTIQYTTNMLFIKFKNLFYSLEQVLCFSNQIKWKKLLVGSLGWKILIHDFQSLYLGILTKIDNQKPDLNSININSSLNSIEEYEILLVIL